jgi:tetratricopeptide (TPR) repeat protein
MFFARPRLLPAFTSCLLVVLFTGAAFLLACHELRDNDVWWHLRAGEWIVQQGKPPDRDPFTFASADQRWIDLHWLFHIVLFLTFRSGGIPAIILFSAALAGAALLVALLGRPRSSPLTGALLLWLPCLLLAADRFTVRPEMATLLLLAAFLAVLLHIEERPRLAWALPLLQLVWVNVHGLFILGPIVLGLRLTEQAARDALRGRGQWRRWWAHVGAASALVLLACLANPYGLDGALFPFVLFPKVTAAGNPYKAYIEEFRTPREFVAAVSPEAAGDKGCICCFYFLLLLLPLSFLLPALWRAAAPPGADENQTTPPKAAAAWAGILAAATALLAARALTLSRAGRPEWLLLAAQSVPAVFGIGGACGAALLAQRSRPAAVLAGAGGIGLACWAVWLEEYLADGADAPGSGAGSLALLLALVSMSIAASLILRGGGSAFRIGLAVAFIYLALSATNSLGRLGLVAGVLLSVELAPWLGRLAEALSPRTRAWGEAVSRLALAGAIGAWMWAICTGWHGGWLTAFPFGLREQPLMFAHDAAALAGQPDMPRRALVFDLAQASVYVFHSAPEHHVFMDARLEVPTQATFQRYVALEKGLQKGDPRTLADIHTLGDPVLLMPHEGFAQGEALLLCRPDWRLVHFDALASVFLPAAQTTSSSSHPTVDLAARHFHEPQAPSQPAEPGAALLEGQALLDVAAALPASSASQKQHRLAILLAALGRAELAQTEEPEREDAWILLGSCYTHLAAQHPNSASRSGWNPPEQLAAAQAVYCFQQAGKLLASDPRPLQALEGLFAAAGAGEARWEVLGRLGELGQLTPAQQGERQRLSDQLDLPRPRAGPLPADLPAELERLLDRGQVLTAVHLAERATLEEKRQWRWQVSDRLAGACMSVGRPALARQVWQSATQPPSEALRCNRLGDSLWVERHHEQAERYYEQAHRLDPGLGLPCWGLAWLGAQQGRAGAALRACRQGLALPLSARLREELQLLTGLLQPHVVSS